MKKSNIKKSLAEGIQHLENEPEEVNKSDKVVDEVTMPSADAAHISAILELKDELYVFYEFQYKSIRLTDGQMRNYAAFVDALAEAGRQAVVMLCVYFEEDTTKPVDAAATNVISYYYNGRWYNNINRTAKSVTDEFIRYAAPGRIPDNIISSCLGDKEVSQ